CVELIATGCKRLLARARHCMCGKGNDRDVSRCRLMLKPARCVPAVDDRQVEIHQDNVVSSTYRILVMTPPLIYGSCGGRWRPLVGRTVRAGPGRMSFSSLCPRRRN